jgi:predicted amidophosphoribosyltransferase
MERDFAAGDLIAPPSRPDAGVVSPAPADLTPPSRVETAWRIAPQSRPLPAGFKLPFLAPYCYSPRGTSPLAEKSRRLRDLIKRADSATPADCAARIATIIDAGIVRDFLGPAIVLVPVPRRVAYDPRDPRSAPEAIARALHAAGHGKIVWPALRRSRTIPKSAWSRPGSRPEFYQHFSSLELVDHEPAALQFLLVDDFVTRGRTLLAAAAVLHQALPCVEIRAFALVRTEGLTPDIAAISAPTIGTIRYLGGDAFRSP